MRWLRWLFGRDDALPPNQTMTWAGLLNRRDVLILDTETSGVSNRSEVVDIALIDKCANVVYEGSVLPHGRIPQAASDVHGLTRHWMKSLGAKPWPEHHASVAMALRRAAVLLAYNLQCDIRLINQTAERCNMPWGQPPGGGDPQRDGRCLMREYASWRMVPHEWRKGEWKLHTLEAAYAREVGGRVEQKHRALADSRMALALMWAVARRDLKEGAVLE